MTTAAPFDPALASASASVVAPHPQDAETGAAENALPERPLSATGAIVVPLLDSPARAWEDALAEAADRFWAPRTDAPLTDAIGDLWDLMEDLDNRIGPWTLEPPSSLTTWRVRPEVVSALSRAWRVHRPDSRANPAWRDELRVVVMTLNGRVRSLPIGEIEHETTAAVAAWVGQRRPIPLGGVPHPFKKKSAAPGRSGA